MKTTTVWKSEQAFDTFQKTAKLEIDGENGFSPKAMLLSGLAVCSGIDIVDVLQKMRVQFTDLEIEVEAEQTTEHPKVFKDIHVVYIIKTDVENKKKFKKPLICRWINTAE